MASFAQQVTCCLLLALVIANGVDARKLKQAVGSKSYSGDITAASSQTSANIQATVANTGKPSAARPGTATKAVTARPLTPLAASSASTVTDSRYASRVTSAGTKFTGADTALQASTAASISSRASGNKPKPAAAATASMVPQLAAQLPVGSTARGAGVATSFQGATSAAISDAVDDFTKGTEVNAKPGPNKPATKATGH